MASVENGLLPETVLILTDRLKHGQNVVHILESQMDTAQQNIVLLQGQVRLANETISNLKKHFHETENLLTKLFEPRHHGGSANGSETSKENTAALVAGKAAGKLPDSMSPIPSQHSGSESNKSYDGKAEHDSSPYAQQLRQVLDVLQEKEPRGSGSKGGSGNVSDHDSAASQPPRHQKHYESGTSTPCARGAENSIKREVKRELNGHHDHNNNVHHHHDASSNASSHHSIHPAYASPTRCTGPCCPPDSGPGPLPPPPGHGYKVVDKPHHYYVRSPPPLHDKHNHDHTSSGPADKYAGHMPYGYQVVDSSIASGIPDSIKALSPKIHHRKRQHGMHISGKEALPPLPPHSKYTTVKRVERSKLTAQKMLQDFAKRQFYSYNPRYDLDLLIVPPPIPAFELLKTQPKSDMDIPQNNNIEMRGNGVERPHETDMSGSMRRGDSYESSSGQQFENTGSGVNGSGSSSVDSRNMSGSFNGEEDEEGDERNSSLEEREGIHTMAYDGNSNSNTGSDMNNNNISTDINNNVDSFHNNNNNNNTNEEGDYENSGYHSYYNSPDDVLNIKEEEEFGSNSLNHLSLRGADAPPVVLTMSPEGKDSPYAL